GAITGEASCSFEAVTDATALRFEASGATIDSGKQPLHLRLQGTARLEGDGVLHVRLSEAGAIRLESGAFLLQGPASLDLSLPGLAGSGRVSVEATTRDLSTVLAHSGIKFRYCLDPGGTITAQADVQLKDGRASLSAGESRWSLGCSCAKAG